MTDRALEAAARDAARELLNVTGNRGRITIETATPWARKVVTAYLDHLLGELPEEAKRAAGEELKANVAVALSDDAYRAVASDVAVEALRSLRGSLNTGGGV